MTYVPDESDSPRRGSVMKEELVEVMARAIREDSEGGARSDAQAAIAAIEAQGWMVVQGWQPIESAPKDGTSILACVSGYVPSQVQWVEFDGVGKWSDDPEMFMEEYHFRAYFSGTAYDPTHWMPLPTSPLAGGE